jgi:hypothetical protein
VPLPSPRRRSGRRFGRRARALGTAATCVVLLAGLAVLGAPAVLGGPAPAAAAEPMDPYASYDGQSTCADRVLPGTAFLLDHLVRTHPGTRSSSLLRECTEGTSEHKDGRALDWGVDAADPAEKAAADAWIEQVLATDREGNAHALARRMGIMYLIWDDHIWRAYDGFQKRAYTACESRTECSKTARHRDHVHISLSRAGAAAQTTFYRARGVPSVPVLYPGTKILDPVGTAEATYRVPADGSPVGAGFQVERGRTYRLVADGLYRAGARSQIADAACRWTRNGWQPDGRLVVNGTRPWGECSDGHTYEALWTAPRTAFLRVHVDETTPGDADGELTFSVLREDLPARSVATRRVAGAPEPRPARRPGASARALVDETLTVRAAAKAGTRTVRALRRPQRYRVIVTGRASSGATAFDGQCVRYAGRWRPQHTLDLADPTADHLSVFVQGVRVPLRAAGGRACDPRTGRYVGTFRPVVNGRSRVRVWDPYTYNDNSGALIVRLRRL